MKNTVLSSTPIQKILIAAAFAALLMSACQPGPVTALSSYTPVQATLGPDTPSEVYSFRPDATHATTLQFESRNVDMPFTAEVRNANNEVIAVLNSGRLQVASLTVPPGDGVYTVRIASSDTAKPGRVAISLSTATPAPASANESARSVPSQSGTVPVSYTVSTAPTYSPSTCQVSTTYPGGVNVRQSPNASADVAVVIPPNSAYEADMRSSDGWYHIADGSVRGWVVGTVISLSGICDSLPVQTVIDAQTVTTPFVGGPVIPGVTAPYDVDVYYFGVNDDGGQFHDAISYPNGDSTDRILMDLGSATTADGRAYSVTLTCSGTGTEYLRWGSQDNPVLMCGQSMPLMAAGQQRLIVTFPGSAGQSYADYALTVAPVAPIDAPQRTFPVNRDVGGTLDDAISFPGGDTVDNILVGVTDLDTTAPNNYRDFAVTLICSGQGAEYVRWGAPENPGMLCNTTVLTSFTTTANARSLAVTAAPAANTQGYVHYTLQAVPVAADDADVYLFSADRDRGGQFTEMISYPRGDSTDRIQLSISNLTGRPPNNYRDMNLMLVCSGQGAEFVRWGMESDPTLLCGSVVTASFLYGAPPQSLVVTAPAGSGQTYIEYALVVVPKAQ